MNTHRARRALLAMICLLAPASAQIVFRGPYKPCVHELGDIDRDGVPDYCANGQQNGDIDAISGKTGRKLYTVNCLCGGRRLADLGGGDVNGDGYPDFLVGRPDFRSHFGGDLVGTVTITSGKDGKVLRRQAGAKKGDEFGYAVAMIGDQNNDGRSEYVVHIRRQGRGATGSPSTHFYDGKSGRERHYITFVGAKYALGALGDINGDKRPEWFACGRNNTYIATSNTSGSVLLATIPIGAAAGEASIPIFSTHFDYDKDGSPDIAISDPHWTRAVYIYAAKDGKLLRTFKAPPGAQGRWGAAMEVLPDVNGDGVVDLLVAGDQPKSIQWWVHIISGRTGELMLTLHEPAYAKTFQRAPVVLGDLNGDGIPEVAVLRRDGEFIYDLQLAGKYGQGCASTPMAPVLRTDLPPRINGLFRLEVDNLLKTTRGLLVFGFSDTRWGSIPLPLGLGQMGMPGCQLLCSWDLADGFATTKGTNRWQWALPNSSKLIGRSIFSQVWAMDAKANPTGIATSNGLRNLVRR